MDRESNNNNNKNVLRYIESIKNGTVIINGTLKQMFSVLIHETLKNMKKDLAPALV